MTREKLQRRKRPYEKFPIEWDFSTELASIPGDAIATHSVVVLDAAGVDQSVSFLASTAVMGSVVQAWVQDGNTQVDYFVIFRITTAAGAKWENDVHVSVNSEVG